MTITAPKTEKNNKNRRGEYASKKVLFGDFNRYAVAAVHTRFDDVEWFVWDAEQEIAPFTPSVIRQESTFEAAIAGLDQ